MNEIIVPIIVGKKYNDIIVVEEEYVIIEYEGDNNGCEKNK